jgi:hypothetical protein
MPDMAILRLKIAIFRPKMAYFDPKMLFLLCFCINNQYSMVKHAKSDNTLEFHSFPKKLCLLWPFLGPKRPIFEVLDPKNVIVGVFASITTIAW